MKHTLTHRMIQLLKDKPNGMSVPLVCQELECTEEKLLTTRRNINDSTAYRLKKCRTKRKFYLEKKDNV